jgi:endonuclease/exonuclease/phosphatase family metal-dependent hydrolase
VIAAITTMKIQLITINTWKCDGDYYKRMQVLADQLKTLTPHIIACQECFLTQDETVDTLRFLAEELDMYYYFTPARLKSRLLGDKEVMSYSGMGILSAFRLDLLEEFDLPTCDADGERRVQQLVIEIGEQKKILLTNIHLTHLSNATDLRKNQLELIAEKTTLTGYDHNLICGDFNCTLESEEIRTFITRTNAVDCYETGGGKEPRVSINNGSGKCVDHIFSFPVVQNETYTAFTKANVVLNEADPKSNIFPSDHFGISTTLITV